MKKYIKNKKYLAEKNQKYTSMLMILQIIINTVNKGCRYKDTGQLKME